MTKPGRPAKPTPTEPPSREEAWAQVDKIPLNASFAQENRRGYIYWFAKWRGRDGKRMHKFVGYEDRYKYVLECHAIVRAELDAARAKAEQEEGPAQRHLRELKEVAFTAPKRAREDDDGPGVVSVPILDPSRPKGLARPRRRASGTR